LNPRPYPANSKRLPIMSTVPTITAGRAGSIRHSALSANCPRRVLIAKGVSEGRVTTDRNPPAISARVGSLTIACRIRASVHDIDQPAREIVERAGTAMMHKRKKPNRNDRGFTEAGWNIASLPELLLQELAK
jgi:hypothetical protein